MGRTSRDIVNRVWPYRKTCAERFHGRREGPLLFVQRCTVSDKGQRGTSRREDKDETMKRKRDREGEAKNSTGGRELRCVLCARIGARGERED